MARAIWNNVTLTNADAAWSYLEPKSKAANITKYVAFWKGVRVET
jgi:uncharacterized protein (DUF427 family)